MPFIEAVEQFVNEFNLNNRINVELIDAIISHPELDLYLSDNTFFRAFWTKLNDLTGHEIEEESIELQYRLFIRILNRLPQEKFALFNLETVFDLATYIIHQNQHILSEVMPYELYHNLRYCLDLIIQRKNDLSFLANLYKQLWQILTSPHVNDELEKEYQEILRSILFKIFSLPRGYEHFQFMQESFLSLTEESSERQKYALLRATLFQLIVFPQHKQRSSFIFQLGNIKNSINSLASGRNKATYADLFIESMDFFNEDHIIEQWSMLVKARMEANNTDEEVVFLLDRALARLIQYIPESFRLQAQQELHALLDNEMIVTISESVLSQALEYTAIEPVAASFFHEAQFQQEEQQALLPPMLWKKLKMTPTTLEPFTEEALNSWLRKLTENTAHKIIAYSVDPACFNIIWEKVMDVLYNRYFNDEHNNKQEQLLSQILVFMSESFAGSSLDIQNSVHKLVYILDSLFQQSSKDPSFNNNLINIIKLIVKNLAQNCEPRDINDLWHQFLLNLTRAPSYFFSVVSILFPLVGDHEKQNFWSQLQSFFSDTVRSYFSEEKDAENEITNILQELIWALPSLLQGSVNVITQQLINLNQTLKLVSIIMLPNEDELSLLEEAAYNKIIRCIREVQLYAMLCVSRPEHLAILNKEVRNFFMHPAALTHPLCISVAMATEKFNHANLDGVNALLAPENFFKQEPNYDDREYFVISMFHLAKWSICHPEWSSLEEKGIPQSTFFRKVINKIAQFIKHESPFMQEVGLEVLKKLIDFCKLHHTLHLYSSYKQLPEVIKNLIQFDLVGSEQCRFINENVIRGITTLYLGMNFLHKLGQELESLKSQDSVKTSLLMIKEEVDNLTSHTTLLNAQRTQMSSLGKRNLWSEGTPSAAATSSSEIIPRVKRLCRDIL